MSKALKAKFKSAANARRLNLALYKKEKEEPTISTKNLTQLLKEKLIDDDESVWFGAQMMYFVKTNKRGASILPNQMVAQRSLVILSKHDSTYGKKDPTTAIYLVQVVANGDNLEVKNSWDLKSLRAIDIGDDTEKDILLSFDHADYSWKVQSQLERDETIWVIMQSCKNFYGLDVLLGYKVDLDVIIYTMKTSIQGMIAKFPLIQALAPSLQIGHDMFASQEEDAKAHLDELKWLSEAPSELLQILSEQSETLNDEIIDFLLQWEDDESGTGTEAAHQRDTVEVLDALTQVDEELNGVDQWIGEQLDRLTETQAKLKMIEEESGTLEVTRKNLTTLSDIVESVVKGLTISEEEGKLLLTPKKTLEAVLQSPSLKGAERILKPLLDACVKFRGALAIKGGSESYPHLTPVVWKQLLSLSAVDSQRTRLREIQESFCSSLGSSFGEFFEALLKHSSLQQLGTGAAVKQSNLSTLLRTSLMISPPPPPPPPPSPPQSAATRRRSTLSRDAIELAAEIEGGAAAASPPVIIPRLSCTLSAEAEDANELVAAQFTFHNAVRLFLPVFAHLLELDSAYSDPLCAYYCSHAAHEGVYTPLFRALFKELQSLMAPRQFALSLASLPPFTTKKKYDFVAKFVPSTSGSMEGVSEDFAGSVMGKKAARKGAPAGLAQQFQSWHGLAVVLSVLTPVIKKEEQFLQTIFRLDSGGMGISSITKAIQKEAVAAAAAAADTSAAGGGAGLHSPSAARLLPLPLLDDAAEQMSAAEDRLNTVFSCLRRGKLIDGVGNPVLPGAAGETDGIEAIAMLVVLQQFLVDHFEISFDGFQPNPLIRTAAPPYATSVTENSKATGRSRSRANNVAVAVPGMNIGYLGVLLAETREILLSKVKAFQAEQVAWIASQRADPKKAGLGSPVAKLPSLICQIVEIVGDAKMRCVDQLVGVLARCTVDWVIALAAQNEKYTDVVLIQNFGFLSASWRVLLSQSSGVAGVGDLAGYLAVVEQGLQEAEARYVTWMVQYEFPTLSSVTKRMEGMGDRVRGEELAVYVRRKDIVSVASELEKRRLEESVAAVHKRVEKHFAHPAGEGEDLKMVAKLWQAIGSHMVSVVKRLEEAASTSYHISLESGPAAVAAAFAHHVS